MGTIIYSILHFLVDMVCAWAMFGFFRGGSQGYLNMLIYNFCAFAMQMPLGTLLDLAKKNGRKRMTLLWTLSGLVLTVAGALVHPAILGLGNALFHVGGGMDVIEMDFARSRKGRDLGFFVAPGAIGLYLGTWLGKRGPEMELLYVTAAVMTVLLISLILRQRRIEPKMQMPPLNRRKKGDISLMICCFLVVILRSWVGLGVSFRWKSEYGLMAVMAVALGKVLGGIISARFGIEKTIGGSLLLAAGCYLLGEIPGFGMAALLLFNMSMPVTLYLLAKHLPGLYGFSFGLLTFALFLGFLPVYTGVELPVSGTMFGAAGSIISLLLLTAAGKAVRHDKVSS